MKTSRRCSASPAIARRGYRRSTGSAVLLGTLVSSGGQAGRIAGAKASGDSPPPPAEGLVDLKVLGAGLASNSYAC